MNTKALGAFEIKDEAQGTVEAVVATLNVVDSDRDVILPGAIRDGSKVKLSSYGHDIITAGAAPVGTATVHVHGDKAILRGRFFMNTQRGREAFETVKALGADGEWSIGFLPERTAPMTKAWQERGATRLLSQVKLVETSPVFIGASPMTSTLATKEAGDEAGDGASGATEDTVELLRTIAGEVMARRDAEKKAVADAAAEVARLDAEAKAAATQEALDREAAAQAAVFRKEFETFQRTMRRVA
jgi:hypothetical protein